MQLEIPIREIKTYQTDDGRKIEEYKKINSIKEEVEELPEDDEQLHIKVLYIGIASAMTEIGPQEIKFPIMANNLKEAFSSFSNYLDAFINEQQNQIVKPDSELII